MPQQFVYDGTDLGVSAIRLGKIPGWIGEAEEGAVGICSVPIDDPTGSLTITGWKPFYVNEFNGPAGQQRLWTGFVNDRNYHRGDADSLRTGAARQIDTNLVDLNAIFSLRLFPQSDTTANRGSETDVARLAWLLSTSYLTTTAYGTVADLGLVSSSGPVTLDAADYRGQSALSLISDCSQASGKNFFPYYKESVGHIGIFYDFDYSAVFDCTLKLSNVLADIDNVTTFMYEEDANLNRDPGLVYSGVQVPFSGTGSPVYRTRAATAAAFISRDTTAPNVNLKTAAAANALGDRYLASIATEDDLLTLTVRLPSTKVTLMREGMRVQVKASHLPDLTSYTYCRILSREAQQIEETPDYYQVRLKLAPPTPTPPTITLFFDLITVPHVTQNGPGDPSKASTIYATAGIFSDPQVGSSYPISYSADSTLGNGTGITGGGTRTIVVSGGFPFTVGQTYTFTLFAIAFGLGTTTQYTDGGTTGVLIDHTSQLPIPGVTYNFISAGSSSGACGAFPTPGGVRSPIGTIQVTYNP